MERVFITIDKYGNTSASSVGIALDELLNAGKVTAGDNLLLTAFGAGLTWGSTVLTHEEKDCFSISRSRRAIPGMGRDFYEQFAAARAVFEEAEDVLKQNFSRIF